MSQLVIHVVLSPAVDHSHGEGGEQGKALHKIQVWASLIGLYQFSWSEIGVQAHHIILMPVFLFVVALHNFKPHCGECLYINYSTWSQWICRQISCCRFTRLKDLWPWKWWRSGWWLQGRAPKASAALGWEQQETKRKDGLWRAPPPSLLCGVSRLPAMQALVWWLPIPGQQCSHGTWDCSITR